MEAREKSRLVKPLGKARLAARPAGTSLSSPLRSVRSGAFEIHAPSLTRREPPIREGSSLRSGSRASAGREENGRSPGDRQRQLGLRSDLRFGKS